MTEIQRNIVWHDGRVRRDERETLLGQTALTIWITGLSGSGKSTLAFALEKALIAEGRICYVLDGDNIRHGLSKDLGFTSEDRSENIRRIAEVAKLMNDAGLIVITAVISPFIADREMARRIIGKDNFREVYVSTPLEVCESLDPKGLYAKARGESLPEFTGLSSPYEPPETPDLLIDVSRTSIEKNVSQLASLVLT